MVFQMGERYLEQPEHYLEQGPNFRVSTVIVRLKQSGICMTLA